MNIGEGELLLEKPMVCSADKLEVREAIEKFF
jgi:hypothetical protein